MFHQYDAEIFQTERSQELASQRWYVSDEDYGEAIRRGMYERSEVAAKLIGGLGRKLATLF